MRPRINFQKNGTSVPFFFFCPLSEIKNELQDCYAQAKAKTQNKKNFFPKYTPPFYLSKYTKSIVCFLDERVAGKASTPGNNSEPRMGGEALVCHNQRPYKKSLCKMTKK